MPGTAEKPKRMDGVRQRDREAIQNEILRTGRVPHGFDVDSQVSPGIIDQINEIESPEESAAFGEPIIDNQDNDRRAEETAKRLREEQRANEMNSPRQGQNQLGTSNQGPAEQASARPADLPSEHRYSTDNLTNRIRSGKKTAENVGKAANKAGNAAKTAQKTVKSAEKAAQAAQKIAQAIAWIRNAATAIGAVIEGAPVIAVAIGIILFLIIVFVVVYGVVIPQLSQNPSNTGRTTLNDLNPVANKTWLKKFMQAAGDKGVQNESLGEFKTRVSNAITTVLEEINKDTTLSQTTKTSLTNDIKNIQAAVDGLSSDETPESARSKVAAAMSALDKYYSAASNGAYPSFNGSRSLPFEDSVKFVGGTGLHFNTKWLPVDAGGHRTFQWFKQNVGDAADFMMSNGTPLYAVMDGTLEEDFKPSCKNLGCKAYILTGVDQSGRQFAVTYGHMNVDYQLVGKQVKANQKIGVVGEGHLHFEISIDQKPVNYLESDLSGASCGGLTNYSIILKSGTYTSKKCKTDKPVADFFWNYTKQIFGNK